MGAFMPIALVLSLLILMSSHNAFAWGKIGHELATTAGVSAVDPKVLAKCSVTAKEIIEHTNDPDLIWKGKPRIFPNEPRAHFHHIDVLAPGWESKSSFLEKRYGFLVYRILEWMDAAVDLKREQKWKELKTKLYGLSHYLGDLTQPLHLHHDHDGQEAGLPGLHSQFETKMVARYSSELNSRVKLLLQDETLTAIWKREAFKTLVVNIAKQSSAKTSDLFKLARPALTTSAGKKRKSKSRAPRFEKSKLFSATGELAARQLSLSARLISLALNRICE
jgi:hypothetical protein